MTIVIHFYLQWMDMATTLHLCQRLAWLVFLNLAILVTVSHFVSISLRANVLITGLHLQPAGGISS